MDKKKILIIDDEEGFTQVAKFNLEETGDYEVKIENRGSQGLAAAREFKPDLVLLDIIMPDIDGGEVADQIKADSITEDIPIIFLTAAVTGSEVSSRGGLIGGHPFIAKPGSLQELIDCIEKTIKK
ncbi:MAG: response regulator [Candidatus Omnitrophica bacterium]|nr:response regulator [Candidatus Omnitrophota bacterium]